MWVKIQGLGSPHQANLALNLKTREQQKEYFWYEIEIGIRV